jgi:hypothetical protein
VLGILFGVITWILENYHIGASGLIYVLVSFIFFKGLQILPIGRAVANCYYFVWRMFGMFFPKVDDSILKGI